MSWLRISWYCTTSQMDSIESALQELRVVSVNLSSADEEEILEPGVDETPQWNALFCEALFPLNAEVDNLRKLLRANGVEDVNVSFLEAADWKNRWRQKVEPMSFGRIAVVPKNSSIPHQRSIMLDPGLAFGTGSHPTTGLCLKWLDSKDLCSKRVLDFGSGSGILSMAAAKLGATKVVAIDHDPQARESTESNAAFNRVNVEIRSTLPADEQFDVVVANILASTLIEHAALLQSVIAEGGEIALSGLLSDQFELVQSAYRAISFGRPVIEDGWLLASGVKYRAVSSN